MKKYNTKRTDVWKIILVTFILLVIAVLCDYMGTIDAWIVNYSMGFLGGTLGFWLCRYNWKFRRAIKKDAVKELHERGILEDAYGSPEEITKNYIRRP